MHDDSILPNNNSSDQSLEPKEDIKFTPDYEKEPIFWHVFNDLSKNNNGLVAYDKQQERLISTGN